MIRVEIVILSDVTQYRKAMLHDFSHTWMLALKYGCFQNGVPREGRSLVRESEFKGKRPGHKWNEGEGD